MKKVALAVAAVVSFVGLVGCGSSPEEDCAANAKATCERMYTCDSALKFGDDQADCEKDMEALCRAAIETNDGKGCEGDLQYDSAKAAECSDAIANQSCEDFNAGNTPAACDQICK